MKHNKELNEVSEIIAKALAERPDLLATIKAQKGAGEKPVPGKRLTRRDHKQYYRNLFSNLNQRQRQLA